MLVSWLIRISSNNRISLCKIFLIYSLWLQSLLYLIGNHYAEAMYHYGGLDILQQIILTAKEDQTLKVALITLANCLEQNGIVI